MSEHLRACYAVTTAILGVDEPTVVRCGGLAGHEGRHFFRIEWDQAAVDLVEVVTSPLGEVVEVPPLSDEEERYFQDLIDAANRAQLEAQANLWRFYAG